jgi:hypothetical protein
MHTSEARKTKWSAPLKAPKSEKPQISKTSKAQIVCRLNRRMAIPDQAKTVAEVFRDIISSSEAA